MLAARALKRSVRVVLTRPQMYEIGYGRAMVQHIELGASADGTLDAITHDAITVTSQYEDFFRQETGWSGLLYKCANARYAHRLAQLDLPTPCDMRPRAPRRASLRSNARWMSLQSRSSSIRSNYACVVIRTATRTPIGRSAARPARMLPPGRGGVRLEQAQSRAALDARRRRSRRLGHGDRRLGSVAGADRRAHRLDRQRSCGGFLRDLRHRHRHLYDHGAGRGRHARPADRKHHIRLGDSTLPQSPVEGGSWIAASVRMG